MTNAILRGKPDAGNPHVRFDEGEVASAKPRRGSLLYKALLGMVFVLAAGALLANPVVSAVAVSQTATVPHIVTITYELSEEAIVTLNVKTNGAAIAGSALWGVGGDVNCRVAATGEGEKRLIRWCPDSSFEGVDILGPNVSFEVTAWSLTSPPNYLVADLRTDSNIWYYASAEAIPGGEKDFRYMRDYMILRRIPAKNVVWTMGLSESDASKLKEDGYKAWSMPRHKVKLTQDYYIGIYPVTESQYFLIRDNSAGGTSRLPKNWVSHSTVTSWLTKLRNRTGLAVSLPTEAQWEFAARAGKDGLLPDGAAYTQDNMRGYGQIGSRHDVGAYKANGWGIYDILGNGWQWCLDWYEHWPTAGFDPNVIQENPKGPDTNPDNQHVVCGNNYDVGFGWTYLSARRRFADSETDGYFIFRVALTLD